jgi:hypothetical protein
MDKKPGRNDPCYCGSGKKYKNCHMLTEKEGNVAKYTPAGKRKIKAKVLSAQDQSFTVFNRSTPIPQQTGDLPSLQRLKFKMTNQDFRHSVEEQIPSAYSSSTRYETPQERIRDLPQENEEFIPTTEDFRTQQE